MNREAAETLALRALAWIAGEERLSGAFLAASGASAEDMTLRAGDAEFLGFVLDFLLADEPALLDFTAAAGLPRESPMRARAALPGGDAPDWT